MSITARWERRAANRWVLKSADGRLWAAITPYTGTVRRSLKATVLGEQVNAYSISKFGSIAWGLNSTVKSAKRYAETYIARRSWDVVTVVA